MIKFSQDKSDAWRNIIKSGAADFGVSLNAGQLDILFSHGNELLKWNTKFNITAITDPFEMAVKHFIDCLALVPHVPNNSKVLDIGSGGGFPGLPLKIAIPSIDLVMLDASRKKISFLNYMIRTYKMTGIIAVHARCEDFAEKQGFNRSFDCVVSRAFTSLDRFIALSLPFLSENGFLLAMKGQNTEQEMQSSVQGEKFCIETDAYTLPGTGYKRSIIKIRSS